MSEQSRVPKPSSGAEPWTSEHISVGDINAGVHVHFVALGRAWLLVAGLGRSWLMLAALVANIHDTCLHPHMHCRWGGGPCRGHGPRGRAARGGCPVSARKPHLMCTRRI